MNVFPQARDRPMHPPTSIAELRRRAPVSRVRLWNGNMAWLLTRYDDVRAAFADARLSADASHPGYPHVSAASRVGREMLPNFMVMDDPEHRRLRDLFLADFMPKPIEQRRPRIQSVVDRRVGALFAHGAPADLLRDYAQHIPAQVLASIMGLETKRSDELITHVLVILRKDATSSAAEAANRELIAFLDAWIDRKIESPGEDMISRLAARMKSGELARRDILGCIRQLFLAGQDSTASTMTMGALLLMDHPDQLGRLLDATDSTLWANAVDEIVRFLSVTHFGRRRVALEDVEIGGQLIRAGEGLILAENYANRDGAVFPDPDRFDVFRENSRRHLGFGFGGHHCLGVHLARTELSLGLSTLFRRAPDLRVAVARDALMFQDDLTIYGLGGLPVAWS